MAACTDTVGDILRQHGTEYLQKYDQRILPSHLKAIRHITACRTPEMGGQKWLCKECGRIQYSYHSCRNRHCSKCQNDRIDAWLEKQLDLLLPVPYFMATITVPEAKLSCFWPKTNASSTHRSD
ncbi:MAG: transposase zinc-binding domain-containing protein [bacterium]